MTTEEELLLEQVVSAHRARGTDGSVRSHPAWHDLGAQARQEAFDATSLSRAIERALDVDGHSSTVKVVLARIRRSRQE